MRQAVIDDATGMVANIILLEPNTGWTPPAGHSIVPATADAVPGAHWDGRTFTRPGPVQPDPDVIRRDVIAEKLRRGNASQGEVQEYIVLRDGIVARPS